MLMTYDEELNRSERAHAVAMIRHDRNFRLLKEELIAQHGEEFVLNLKREALENVKY